MYVTLYRRDSLFFPFFLFSLWLDVRGSRNKGNVAEAMEEGCRIRGAQSSRIKPLNPYLDGLLTRWVHAGPIHEV